MKRTMHGLQIEAAVPLQICSLNHHITSCKLQYQCMCDKNNLTVSPMVLERNNCCRSIFVTEACDRGDGLLCQAPQQAATVWEGAG